MHIVRNYNRLSFDTGPSKQGQTSRVSKRQEITADQLWPLFLDRDWRVQQRELVRLKWKKSNSADRCSSYVTTSSSKQILTSFKYSPRGCTSIYTSSVTGSFWSWERCSLSAKNNSIISTVKANSTEERKYLHSTNIYAVVL